MPLQSITLSEVMTDAEALRVGITTETIVGHGLNALFQRKNGENLYITHLLSIKIFYGKSAFAGSHRPS
jgi:hypothetical protein